MIEGLRASSSPHLRQPRSISGIMVDVCIALLPAALYGVFQFGWNAAMVMVVSVFTAVATEVAIELIKRGHRIIADDAVEIKETNHGTLVASAPELIRHYIEIRGIGVIDVQQLFGMGSVQFDTELDLVVQLEKWVDGKFYDRLGLGEEMYSILGVKLPYMIIPVRPGRNLAGIVEIATMKNRQMKFGYNPARDFVDRVDRQIDALTRQSEEQK